MGEVKRLRLRLRLQLRLRLRLRLQLRLRLRLRPHWLQAATVVATADHRGKSGCVCLPQGSWHQGQSSGLTEICPPPWAP
eukprot:gene11534-biopygen1839